MQALLIEPGDLIAEAIGRQLDLGKVNHDRVDLRILLEMLSGLDDTDIAYDAIIVGDVGDTAGCVSLLRASHVTVPIIALINRRCAVTTAGILRAGADDVLVKPVVSTEIQARLEAIRRRAYGLTSNAVDIGRLTVFLDGRDPQVGPDRLRLSQREHAILSVLALNHRRVVSKEHIYEAVYGLSGSDPLDKVIDVYICKLRKKIDGATGGGRYIETVYGRGYKLEAPPDHAPSLASPSLAPVLASPSLAPALAVPSRTGRADAAKGGGKAEGKTEGRPGPVHHPLVPSLARAPQRAPLQIAGG